MHAEHRMVLADLRGESKQRNGAYIMRIQGCPIKLQTIRPLTEGEAAFYTLKGEVYSTKWPPKA